MNFPVTRCGSKGDRVQIVDDDLFPPGARIGAFPIGLQAGAENLSELFDRRVGAAIGRMTKFFQLNGERAAALDRYGQIELGADIKHERLQCPVPLDYRVLPWCSRVIEVAILEKKQGLYEQRRNAIHLIEQELALTVAKQGDPVRAQDLQTCGRLFRVGR